MAAVAVYGGRFGAAQAERLLWRAGFGPRKGEAAALAKLGLEGAVHKLTSPGAEKLVGPSPTAGGQPLAPYDAWGHDHLWWLDRMVRTSRPLVERMALVWHDWFATSGNPSSQRAMLDQNEVFRRGGLGSFEELLLDVTKDPAMLLWLNGTDNSKSSPNENYAREMMELFSLGAGQGYGEDDVRQQARALTGFRNDWTNGATNFRFDPSWHDNGVKTIFGKRGRYGWKDSCRLCVTHADHPGFFVSKLWSYFIPTPPDASTAKALQRLYVHSRYSIRAVTAAILRHPELYNGPRMVKGPVLYNAGLLRRLGRGVDTLRWVNLDEMSGQRLFFPPNVAGWDDSRWLDTATWRGRWWIAEEALRPFALDPEKASRPANAQALVNDAAAFLHNPPLTAETRRALLAFAQAAIAPGGRRRAVMTANALRHLIAVSPELQAA